MRKEYFVVLAIAVGSTFDSGERIEMRVMAKDRLDAAIIAEQCADATLSDPIIQYTHALDVVPINQQSAALALAA